jgi:uncharacterized protein YndB with AHSA1/START domain/uncharacterized damage-inducible protein DinB
MSAPQLSTATLRLTRVFAAPRERVFRAWTEASELTKWFHPSAEYTTRVRDLDFRVGGVYRIEMHHQSGKVSTAAGTYKEIAAPERLVFSWHWEEKPNPEETLVTVDFRSLGDSTEVTLTHTLFSSENERTMHAHGWEGCLTVFSQVYGAGAAERETSRSIASQIITEMDQESQSTRKLLERIPEDKLSWRPHPKSYSLGQLGLHIAAGPGALSTAVAQDVFELPSFIQSEPKSTAEILDVFAQSLATAKERVGEIDDARAMAIFSVVSNGKTLMALPRVAFMRSILMNHIYHHRGQLSVYLRLLDVPVPSIYGPSADENPFL